MGQNSCGDRLRSVVHRGAVLTVSVVAAAALCCSVSPGRAAAAGTAASTTWWVPSLGSQPWQWELDHPLRLGQAKDMGTDDKLPDGQPAPPPVIYDLDGIITPASTVAALHALGAHVVCYVEVGAVGNYYSASDEGISTTYFTQLSWAGDLGKKVGGYPERYLDIRALPAAPDAAFALDLPADVTRNVTVLTDKDAK